MTAIRNANEGVATLVQPSLEEAGHPPPAAVDALLWQLSNPQERRVLLQGLSSATAQAAAQAASPTQAAPVFTRDGQGLAVVRRTQPSWLDAPARAAASSPAASGAVARSEQAGLNAAVQSFQNRFASAASEPDRFNAMMRASFGQGYDARKLEAIRQQSLAGDFSWMPQIKLADAAALRDLTGAHGGTIRGAYAQAQDTVYLNRDLLKDPALAEQVLGEEVGHAIDARINTSDAAGDEGHLFTELLHGQTVDTQELQALRAENDHGAIQIGGRREEVEFDDGGGGDSGSSSSESSSSSSSEGSSSSSESSSSSSEGSASASEGSSESSESGESSASEGSEGAGNEGADGAPSGADGEGSGASGSEGTDSESATSGASSDNSGVGDDDSAATDSLSDLAAPAMAAPDAPDAPDATPDEADAGDDEDDAQAQANKKDAKPKDAAQAGGADTQAEATPAPAPEPEAPSFLSALIAAFQSPDAASPDDDTDGVLVAASLQLSEPQGTDDLSTNALAGALNAMNRPPRPTTSPRPGNHRPSGHGPSSLSSQAQATPATPASVPMSSSPYAGGGSFAGYTTGSTENSTSTDSAASGNTPSEASSSDAGHAPTAASSEGHPGHDDANHPDAAHATGAVLAAAAVAVEGEAALAVGAALAEAVVALAPPVLAGAAISAAAWMAYQYFNPEDDGSSSEGGSTPPPPSPAPDYGQGETLPMPSPEVWGDGVLEHPAEPQSPSSPPPSGSTQPTPATPPTTTPPPPEQTWDDYILLSKPVGNDPKPSSSGRVQTLPTGQVGGEPMGAMEKETDAGKRAQNEALRILAAAGYRVTSEPKEGPYPTLTPQQQQDLGLNPNKKPDAIIEGEVFDVYTPETGVARNVADNIAKKVVDRNGDPAQAHRVVVNLKDSTLTPEQIIEQLELRVPALDELEELIFVDRNGVVSHYVPGSPEP